MWQQPRQEVMDLALATQIESEHGCARSIEGSCAALGRDRTAVSRLDLSKHGLVLHVLEQDDIDGLITTSRADTDRPFTVQKASQPYVECIHGRNYHTNGVLVMAY